MANETITKKPEPQKPATTAGATSTQATGKVEGKKRPSYPAGSDPRPTELPVVVPLKDQKNTTPENTEKGKLGHGGPRSHPETGKNLGNMREEKEQSPTQNAVAAGPTGHSPSAEPGMSHP